MSTVNSKMTAIADEIRILKGTTAAMGLDAMASNLNEANTEVDSQADLISLIQNAIDNLPEAGSEGGNGTITLQDITITQNGTYTADQGYDGLGTVIVNIEGVIEDVDPRDQYQRVEYITSAESETYPYIITDFVADNTCGLEIIASFPSMQDRIPMGSRLDSNATRFYCVYPLSTSSCYYGFNTGASISCALSVDTLYRLQTNFMNSRLINIYDINGIRKGGTSISQTLTQQACPVAIFGYNRADTEVVSSKREYKLYSARCSQGHEIVREYIPCYRKSDGVIGLYEKFTGEFLINQGTGTFTKGADIDW